MAVSQLTVADLLTNRLLFIEQLLKIEDKDRVIRPFVLNPIQRRLYPEISQPGSRLVMLKPSQVGFTTLVMADFLVDTITRAGTTSVVVAYDEFITQRIMRKAHFFYDNLPNEFKPRSSHRSANELLFPDINSVLYIGSSRSYTFGRGEAIHNFLADEYAFWENPDRIMVPALQRITANGRFIVGSTPNGEDNAYHDLYQAAKSGTSQWRAVFFPWYAHDEYFLPRNHLQALPNDRLSVNNLTPEEQALVKRGVNEDQLRWRRAKIAELNALRRDGQNRLLFGQEFPEDDVTCFLAAGDAVYDSTTLDNLARGCFPAPYGYEGALVWEPPTNGRLYLVSVDPGLGKQARSACTVWRFDPKDGMPTTSPVHCATLVGYYDPEETASKANSLARYYGNATLAVEANSHGLAVISELRNVHHYPNLYMRRDIVTGRVGQEVGWLTTPRTKPYLVNTLIKLLPNVVCHDINIVSELRGIRWHGSNTIAMGLEDLHMSTAIAMACRDALPAQVGFVGTGGWDEDWG